MSTTTYFFVVDGDTLVDKKFDFSSKEILLEPKYIYVWRSKNPVNGLVYGHGGVKLIDRTLFETFLPPKGADVATGVTKNYRKVDILASEHRFNVDPFRAWRCAFRESTKLYTQFKVKQCELSQQRLISWSKEANTNEKYWQWVLLGANDGIKYAKKGIKNITKINNFDWLEKRFKKDYSAYIEDNFNSVNLNSK